MPEQDIHDRLTRIETQVEERTRESQQARAEMKVLLQLLGAQQVTIAQEMGKLTAQFAAHLAEDRQIIQLTQASLRRVNGNHQQERLVNIGLGAGSGVGIASIIVAIGRQLGWL